MMIIQQTVYNHIKVLWLAMVTTVLYLLAWWYFGFKKDAGFIFFGLYILTVVPSFFLHINYYIRNKGLVCEILPDKLRLKRNGEEVIIANTEIKEIIVYKSASIDKGGIPITPMEVYFFVRVLTKDEKKYDMTCLMDGNIDKSIRSIYGVRIHREKGILNIT